MRKKVAVITGAGKKRLGNAIARTLADHGYCIAIHYNSSHTEATRLERLLGKKGIDAATFQADLRLEGDVEAMTDAVFKRFGHVDVLVNSAAIWRPVPLEEIDADEFRQNFETNTLGTFLTCQKVGLRMAKQSTGGCIINIGDWCITRPYLNYAAYMPSKGAIPTLTRTFAHELAARNPKLRVNCIMPGPVMLPKDMPEEEKARAINATLLKREGKPENVAHAALFLIENDFITGVCIPVDGGRSIYAPENMSHLGGEP
ncbi:MAG: SDR family oxidoreductase [Planctomycetota bacterium]|nr:SDR family oxidoreductase [Planctomycetota bacterium]